MEKISCEFEAAYVLVCELAARLEQGQHFRDRHGRALLTLDELIAAILDGRWPAELGRGWSGAGSPECPKVILGRVFGIPTGSRGALPQSEDLWQQL